MKSILQKTIVKTFLALMLMLSFVETEAQVSVSYTAMTTVTFPATPVATISPAVTGLTFSQISRGSGVLTGAAAGSISGSGFNGTLAANITASKWYTYSITSVASTTFTVNSLSIVSRASNATGANVSVQYSIGAGAKTVIGSYTPTTSAATYAVTPGAAIAVGAGQVINIFIIPNGLSASTTTCRVENNTSVNVTATAGAVAPTVTNTAASSITTTSATLAGNVTATGGSAVLLDGSVYSTSDTTPTIAESATQVAASVTGTTGPFSASTGSVLTANTRYYYNAYANNAQGTSYGTAANFYTLANVPLIPISLNSTTTTIAFNIDTTNNPIHVTQYAIQINGGSYVQANGTLGGSPFFQTDFLWQVNAVPSLIEVTGLTSNTLYSIAIKARNGSNVETAFGPSASITTLPILTPLLAAGTLTAFGNACINATTTPNSFTLTGTNLTGSDVTVGPLLGFTFDNGSGYGSTVLITGYGTAISTTINVKFTPTLVQSYSGNIPVTGGGATTINVAASGSGINTAVAVTTGASSAITSTGATLAGSIVPGCSTVVASGIEYSLFNTFMSGVIASGFPAVLTGLQPNTQYFYRTVATDGTGAVTGTSSSFTTLGLSPPVATAGTGLLENQFTANWNTLDGALDYRLDVSISPTFGITTPTSNLFISEYGEGTPGNRKYVEIYNGTGAAVNLANYQIWRVANGTATSVAWAAAGVITLTGTLANGSTYVIANNATDVPGANLYNGTIINWNGDDAVGLAYNGGSGIVFTLLDAVGTDLVDPGSGWAVAGTAVATVDKILIRKSTVFAPNTNWVTSAGTTVGNSEWIVSANPYNASFPPTNLGAHTINNVTPSFVTGYENLTVAGTSQVVSGLTASTNYYYRVRGVSTNSTSSNSNVITVLTSAVLPTFASIAQVDEVICDNTNATFNVNGLLANSTSTIYYNINGGTTQSVTGVLANGSGFATFNAILTLANNGQTLTVTSIERTDIVSPILNVTIDNTALLGGVIVSVTYYRDADGDGFGNPALSITTCDVLSGYSTNNTDCDDNNFEANPNHVEILGNSIDDNCSGIADEVGPLVKVIPSQCGLTITRLSDSIFCTTNAAATGYRFEVSNGAFVRSYNSVINRFNLLNILGVSYATTYSIRVSVKVGGFWQAYGTACNITSPAGPPTTNVIPSQCGMTITNFWNSIFVNQVTEATGYLIELTDAVNGVRTYAIPGGGNRFNLRNFVGGAVANTVYTVRVAILYNSVYQSYGAPCTITTSVGAVREMQASFSEFAVSAYPNPFADNFKLDINTLIENGIEVKVYDMIGRQVDGYKVNTADLNTLEVGANYPAGVYNIVVSQGENVKTLRVIKR